MITRGQAAQILGDWSRVVELSAQTLKPRSLRLRPSSDFAYGFVGVRRCGKSWAAIDTAMGWARDHLSGRIVYLNFEDPAFLGNDSFENIDLLLSVDSEKNDDDCQTLILDEVQNIQGWERWVRKAVDSKRYHIIITGSSAKLLSSELATSLAGRCIEKNIWPLSYGEYLFFLGAKPSRYEQHLKFLNDYLQWGGFPAVVLQSDLQVKRDLLKQYTVDLLSKDVITRNAIRDRRALEQVTRYLATNLSSRHTYQAIRKAFGITVDTAADYTRFLADAFYCFEVHRYHPNMKVQHRDPKKIYLIDVGISRVLTQSVSEDRGKLIENTVYLELRRRDHEVSYYSGKQECDFILTRNGTPFQAIQVCDSNLTDEVLRQREVGGLVEACKALKLKRGTIVTDQVEDVLTVEGVKVNLVPLHVFLLNHDQV